MNGDYGGCGGCGGGVPWNGRGGCEKEVGEETLSVLVSLILSYKLPWG